MSRSGTRSQAKKRRAADDDEAVVEDNGDSVNILIGKFIRIIALKEFSVILRCILIKGGFVLPPVGGSVAERYAVSSNSGKKARSQLNCITFAAGVPITAEMILNRAAANHGEDDRFTEIENIGLREVLMTQVTMPPARKNSQGTEVRLCGPLLEKDALVDFTKT